MFFTIFRQSRRFILARSTVTILLSLVAASVITASVIPQTFLTSPVALAEWQAKHPLAGMLAANLGLHHLYTSPLFVLILLLAMLSLAVSTVEQGGRAWKRTFASPALPPGAPVVKATADRLFLAAGEYGYVPVNRGTAFRFVRHPWGYWGGFLLHLGLVTTLAASLVITLTQQRASAVLVQGEPHLPDDPWGVVESGMLAEPLRFARQVTLRRIMPQFHPTGKTARLESDVSFSKEAASEDVRRLSVNGMIAVDNTHVYQSTDFGHAFRIDFATSEGEVHHFTLPMYHPQNLHEAGFREFRLPVSPLRLDAKYVVDEAGRSLMEGRPVMTLRLVDGEHEVSRATLRPGESARLEPFGVTLREVTPWTELIFVRIHGMAGIFAGFALCILGAVLGYCCPPRELLAVPEDERYRVAWRSEKFGAFYADEGESLLRRCTGEET